MSILLLLVLYVFKALFKLFNARQLIFERVRKRSSQLVGCDTDRTGNIG